MPTTRNVLLWTAAVVVLVLGALVVTFMGLISPLASDVCSDGSTAPGCTALGRKVGFFAGAVGGPLSLPLGFAVAWLLGQRRLWGWCAFGIQFALILVISATALSVD